MSTPVSQQALRLSRRHLLAAGAGLAAAGISMVARVASAADLAPPGKQPASLPKIEPRSKKLGWAVVGLGELSLAQILPAFAVANLSKPVALVSGHPDKAKSVAEHYDIAPENIYSYENFDLIKNNPAIDIVYIVLPNSMHAEFTVRALRAGKHVLCEKPLAATIAEAEQMVAEAKAARRKLMTAYRLRYEPFNQKMIELARSKEFGAIRVISAENMQDVKAPNIRLSKKLAGGPLGDVGVYCLNAARYITGEEPIEVFGMAHQPTDDPRFAEVPDRFSFQLRFASGIIANCASGFSSQETRRYSVICEKGTFGLDPAFSYSGLSAFAMRPTGRETLRIEAANHFAAEMDHFSAAVVSDSPVTTPGEDGLQDVRIMAKIVESALEGRVVRI